MSERYIGLMSGTSMDGIDAVLDEQSCTGLGHFIIQIIRHFPLLSQRVAAVHADGG